MPLKNAVALRAFDHAGDTFAVGPVHRIDAGHFADWEAAGLVREATAAEISKASGEKPTPKRPRKPARKVKPAVPASAASDAQPSPVDPDPAAPAA